MRSFLNFLAAVAVVVGIVLAFTIADEYGTTAAVAYVAIVVAAAALVVAVRSSRR
jgi:hypothetical protein